MASWDLAGVFLLALTQQVVSLPVSQETTWVFPASPAGSSQSQPAPEELVPGFVSLPFPEPGYEPIPAQHVQEPGYEPFPQPGYEPFPQPGYEPFPQPGYEPVFQPGDLSHSESVFEHGDHQSETEELNYPQQHPPGVLLSAPAVPPGQHPNPIPYPYYDHMFLTGQYPPGLVTHYSSDYEQGTDNWQSADYVRDNYYYAFLPPPQAPEQGSSQARLLPPWLPRAPVGPGYVGGGAVGHNGRSARPRQA